MGDAKFSQINKDWTTVAEFRSGINEYVLFYPIEVINLKTKEKIRGLQLDMFVKNPDVFKTAFVGLEEIEEFIAFIGENVVPNLDKKLKNKSSEYIFQAKEMKLSYLIDENRKRLSISLNSYDNDETPNYYFWTETQSNKIPKLLDVLKIIK